MKITVVSGSTRENSNSEWLANRLIEGHEVDWLKLREYKIHPIVDQRHTPGGFTLVDDDYDTLIKQVVNSDLIVFATPLYWYGMSGLMKNFIDRWSQSLRDTTFDFRQAMEGKRCFLLIVGGNQVHLKALPLVQQFQLIFEFMKIDFKGYLIGQGSKPGEVKLDHRGLAELGVWREKFQLWADEN
ncbi:Multimeric flavodoxin WrbA [Seinonella peptonophila]|uniref:Multimeric flavodoxin WrbA n=1 Tax=Seinonella peptonophila TaxID=112248 RepID=A0A1M4W994_9BACL|nr:flavodoxin family protein [Seinonella peptonophila]SHE77777.1 Multimeric flavodoxin WrbA [Seinonella peptonophila]